jgi:hypothetical protein
VRIRLSGLTLWSALKQETVRVATQDGCCCVDRRIKGLQTELLYELWKCDVIQTADVPKKRRQYTVENSGEEKRVIFLRSLISFKIFRQSLYLNNTMPAFINRFLVSSVITKCQRLINTYN